MWKIPLFDLNYDEKEKTAVSEVINGKWLSMGPVTESFEKEFSEYLGGDVFSNAVSSGTAALHLALMANGICEGDEVIVSGLTFVAAVNVVKIVGATPVLADSSSLSDWNVSSEDIRTKITKKTKAVILVHFAGHPCEMDEIMRIAIEHDLVVIEDAAHAPGAEYRGRKCGTIGDIGCFSFFSNKNLSTGEGGMVVTRDPELHGKFKLLRSHGMTSMTIDRFKDKAISYDVLMPGLNYRIDEIRSALGRVQLEKLDGSNEKRRLVTEEYQKSLEGIPGLVVPWVDFPGDRKPSYHIFPVLLPENADRRAMIEHMKENGIQTSIHYPAFRQFTHYRDVISEPLPVAEEISRRVLTLPLYAGMTTSDVKLICDALKEGLNAKG